tara:strand:- start:207 stop:551 length:345 start_codon:yes stop_codon:yes gene_type:complete
MRTFTNPYETAIKLRKQYACGAIVNIFKILHVLNKKKFDQAIELSKGKRWNLAIKVANILTDKSNINEVNYIAWLLLVDDQQAETLRFRESWQWADYFQIPDKVANDYLKNSFR